MPAKYNIIADVKGCLIIRDIGPWSKHYTVTNDAENVVRDLAPRLKGRRLFYIDSEDELCELRVNDKGLFAGFGGSVAWSR